MVTLDTGLQAKRDCRAGRYSQNVRGQIAKHACRILAVVFATLYLELFIETCEQYFTGEMSGILFGSFSYVVFARVLLLLLVFGGISFLLMKVPSNFFEFIFRWRYLLAGVCFIILLAFSISFSSIGIWQSQLGGGNGDGLLFGIPRAIRSDEYNVTTLFNISQEHCGYNAISAILRGDSTDTRLVYNLASWSIPTLFRPLLWGYLIFGSARGLSFYWLLKYFGVFFASFECGRLFTNNSKGLSAAFALFITFSPLMLWWSIWEGVIYGQLLVVSLHQYLHSTSMYKAVLWGLVIAWLCGCYIFVLYPAWMVPFFYVFAFMGIIVLIRFIHNREKRASFKLIYLFPLLAFAIGTIALILASLVSSRDVLAATSSTVYPGDRFEIGGGSFGLLFNYGYSLFFALAQPIVGNASESSSMFSLFPLGTILTLIAIGKTKKPGLVLLSVLQAAFIVYVSIGFPEFLAAVTLMSNSPASRVVFAVGYLEILLIFYSVSELVQFCSASSEGGLRKKIATSYRRMPVPIRVILPVLLSVAASVVLLRLFGIGVPDYSRFLWVVLLALAIPACLISVIGYVFSSGSDEWKRTFLVISVFIVAVSGICVHPVQKGIAPVTNSDFARNVSAVVQEDPESKWIVEGPWSYANLCTALGAPTIGSTNMYPDMVIWRVIDPTGKYEEMYNRYAHVSITLTEQDTEIIQTAQDAVDVHLSYKALRDLGIEYVASINSSYDGMTVDGISFDLVGSGNGVSIYRISY